MCCSLGSATKLFKEFHVLWILFAVPGFSVVEGNDCFLQVIVKFIALKYRQDPSWQSKIVKIWMAGEEKSYGSIFSKLCIVCISTPHMTGAVSRVSSALPLSITHSFFCSVCKCPKYISILNIHKNLADYIETLLGNLLLPFIPLLLEYAELTPLISVGFAVIVVIREAPTLYLVCNWKFGFLISPVNCCKGSSEQPQVL